MTLEELVDNFEFLDSWEERYSYIIDLGRKLPPFPEEHRTDENKVRGCISQVWMVAETPEDNPEVIRFVADSDAAIVKGLIGIVLMLYSERTPQDILALKTEDLFTKLGLESHLSVNRRNGFQAMLDKIKTIAAERVQGDSLQA
ncbi:MAG: SufE family protein [Deltaproteobacteria bacterium]|nr:MAG: SufE family protein [Deltaproteobacteria bacterium]